MIAGLTSNLNPTNDWIEIGTLLKPVGLKGEIRVFVQTDFIEQRFKVGETVYYQDQNRYLPLEIESMRLHKEQAVLRFKGYPSLEAVAAFNQKKLFIHRQQRHELAVDDYYFDELLNLEVYQNQQYLGKVIEVFEQPASTILRIQTDTNVFLLPFVKAFVQAVDLKAGRIDVQLIEGFYEN